MTHNSSSHVRKLIHLSSHTSPISALRTALGRILRENHRRELEMGTSATLFDEDARAQREEANTNTHLLSLPAELRIRIYTLATDNKYSVLTSQLALVPKTNVLQTSRQLRKETTPIIYGQFLCFGYWNWLSRDGTLWLDLISENAVRCLRHVDFSCSGNYLCEDGEIHNHTLEIAVLRSVKRFSYLLRSYWERLTNPKIHEYNDCENCAVARYWHRKAMPVLDRMKSQNCEAMGYSRDDLLALYYIMRDLRSHEGEYFEELANIC